MAAVMSAVALIYQCSSLDAQKVGKVLIFFYLVGLGLCMGGGLRTADISMYIEMLVFEMLGSRRGINFFLGHVLVSFPLHIQLQRCFCFFLHIERIEPAIYFFWPFLIAGIVFFPPDYCKIV